MNRLEQHLTDKLNERKLAGNLRQLRTRHAAVDFFSNDYLGLATGRLLTASCANPRQDVTDHYTGSTGSRLLSGNSQLAEELERTIAAFHRAEASLLFNSGYDANVGVITAITNRHTTILYDELCHASIIDGVRLSQGTRKYKVRHNDTSHLAGQLQKYTALGPVLVIVESVYSMDGDMAPLTFIAQLCKEYNAQLMVDEAHATGVVGDDGAGAVCMLGLENMVFARLHTFGKALGCHGAAVAGSSLLRDYLINFARTFIYTTALPGHSVMAVARAYQYLVAPSFTNKPLSDLILYFRSRVADSRTTGFMDSHTPIQGFVAGDNKRCRQLADNLYAAGLQVSAILHPTVPAGSERLRICLHVFNTPAQVDLLFSIITGKS